MKRTILFLLGVALVAASGIGASHKPGVSPFLGYAMNSNDEASHWFAGGELATFAFQNDTLRPVRFVLCLGTWARPKQRCSRAGVGAHSTRYVTRRLTREGRFVATWYAFGRSQSVWTVNVVGE